MSEIMQVVEFELGDKTFATDISNVREIVEKPDVTELPNTPEPVDGVMNLRGETATLLNPKPILDVTENGDENRILVTSGGDNATGVLVDSVNEVYEFSEEDLEETDELDEEGLSKGVFRNEESDTDEFVVLIDLAEMEADISTAIQQRT